MTISLTETQNASRFFQRWTNSRPHRTALVAQLSQSALDNHSFTHILQQELDGAPATPATLAAAMRRVRNAVVCTLISRDLEGKADLAEVLATISGFADFAVQTLEAAIHAELADIHGTPVGEHSGQVQRMIVLGMGKLGGRELNVSSDIDLIFIFPEHGETVPTREGQRVLSNQEFFTRLGKKLIGALSEVTEDGQVFRVDMALRPNGNSGPLVASLDMVEDYLIYQGRDWERYAWVKARAVTGEQEAIDALTAISTPFVYRRYLDYGSIDALRSMHGQIRAEVRRQEALHPDRSNNVKLGRGGIREIEFVTQVYQLIRGGRDHQLRDPSTRTTLHTLAEKHLLAPEIVDALLAAYTFLRNLEHRLQYLEDAQTHTLPTADSDVLLMANAMGYADTRGLMQELDHHRKIVAAQFDAIFQDRQSSSGNETCLSLNDSEEVIAIALQEMGFSDTTDLAHRLHSTLHSSRLQHLPESSLSKFTALLQTALSIIRDLPEGHLATLGRLLDFFEAIARRAAYLALLTEYPHTLSRLIRMMAASDWAAKYLTRHPILLDELLDSNTLNAAPDWVTFDKECRQQIDSAAGDTERQMDILREMHHAQMFRLLAQDLEGNLSIEHLADHLSALADILVNITIDAVWKTIAQRHREVPLFTVIAYGKLGGKELGYVSDLDVVFLYDDDDQEAPALYAKLAQRFITWMTSHTPAGMLFDIDTALRPDGASGLIVSSFPTFEKYQNSSAWLWEHQALTRARYCAGDKEIGVRFEALRIAVLRKERDENTLRQEVVSMRQRMREGNRNNTDLFDLKHDAGGMIDIEFIVQYLVLRHAASHEALTGDIGNIALLKLCGTLGLINNDLASEVANAYRVFRKLQHQCRLQGDEKARVTPERVTSESASVRALWQETFGASA